MNTTPYEKLRTAMIQRLKGMAKINKAYSEVVSLFYYVDEVHSDEVRKDGVTRGFYHQLSGLAFAMNFHDSLTDPVAVYANILVHDTIEDYPHCRPVIRARWPEHYEDAELISKYREMHEGKLPLPIYFRDMPASQVVSVTKPIDRLTNISTMQHLSIEKQKENIQEVYDYFFPMMKEASCNFPEQEAVYEQLKSIFHIVLPIALQKIDAMEELLVAKLNKIEHHNTFTTVPVTKPQIGHKE